MSLTKACAKIIETMDAHGVAYTSCEIVDNPPVVRIHAFGSDDRQFTVRYDEQKCFWILGRFFILEKSDKSGKIVLAAMKECAELSIAKTGSVVIVRHIPDARKVIRNKNR
jgi:hypothetical protein